MTKCADEMTRKGRVGERSPKRKIRFFHSRPALRPLSFLEQARNNGVAGGQGVVPRPPRRRRHPRPLLRRPPPLLEDLRHRPRDPREQADRPAGVLSDCVRSAEVGRVVPRRIGLRRPGGPPGGGVGEPEAASRGQFAKLIGFDRSIRKLCRGNCEVG